MAEVAVVTYNVHSCVGTDGHYSMDRIARLVQREHPDIVCFQEIEVTTTTTTTTTNNNNTKNKNSNNTIQQQHEEDTDDDDEEEEQQQGHQTRMWSAKHFDNQPEYIAKMLRLDHVAFASAISSKVVVDDGSYVPYPYCRKELHNNPNNGGDTIGQFGVCILSRYPILETKRFKYTQYGSRTQKNTIACLVQIPSSNTTNDDDDDDDEMTTGTSVWIINTHLGSHPTGNEQFQQATELSKVIQSLIDDNDTTNPIPGIAGIILCGDFNSLPFFQSIQTLEDIGMKDVWKQKEDEGGGIGLGHTFPAPGGLVPCTSIIPPLMRLDYLFTTSLKRYTIHTLSIHVVNQGTSIVATASNSDSDNSNSNSNDDGDSDKIIIDIKASDHLALSAMFSIEKNSI